MPIIALVLYHLLMLFALVLAREALPSAAFSVVLPMMALGSVAFLQAARTQRMRRPLE